MVVAWSNLVSAQGPLVLGLGLKGLGLRVWGQGLTIYKLILNHKMSHFRSSQNEWVEGQSSSGNFTWNQQNHQYPEATASHYPYNYSSNNNRMQQQYSNNYHHYQQQQERGAGYSYQSYYGYGYQCPNGDSRSSGTSFTPIPNVGTSQASCNHIKEDESGSVIASQDATAKEQRKVKTIMNEVDKK